MKKKRKSRRNYETKENNAFLDKALARIDSALDREYGHYNDGAHCSSDEDDYLGFSKREKRPLIPSNGDTSSFAIESFVNEKSSSNWKRAERIQSVTKLDHEKRSNFRLSLYLILLLLSTGLIHEYKRRNRYHPGGVVKNETFVYNADVEREWFNEKEWFDTSHLKMNETELEPNHLELKSSDVELSGKNGIDSNITTDAKVDYSDTNRPEDISDEEIWKPFNIFSNWKDPFVRNKDIPVFWRIPRAGGATMNSIMSHCLLLVGTSQIGVSERGGEENILKVVPSEEGGSYLNVDTMTKAGIERAREMNLTQSGLADIISTPYIRDIASLFNSTTSKEKIKCFVILRHPIQRALSLFYELRDLADKDPLLNVFKNMTIEDYANSEFSEENWMVRFMTNEMKKPLHWHHLKLAKEILGKKCMVGFIGQYEESIKRFDQYFGWDDRVEPQNKTNCEKYLIEHHTSQHNVDIKESSEIWELLKKKNSYDLKLYEHALTVFEKQLSSE